MIRYYIAISVTLSQIWNSPVNIQYCKPSDWLDIVSQHQNENSSSIDIENIAAANNRYTNTQEQPLSSTPIYDSTEVNQQLLSGSPAQQSFIETRRPTDLNTSTDITDDTSSTLIHALVQDINGVDNSSDVRESQS